MIPAAKFGRLGTPYFCEVGTWLPEVRFRTLSAFGTPSTLKVIEGLPDGQSTSSVRFTFGVFRKGKHLSFSWPVVQRVVTNSCHPVDGIFRAPQRCR